MCCVCRLQRKGVITQQPYITALVGVAHSTPWPASARPSCNQAACSVHATHQWHHTTMQGTEGGGALASLCCQGGGAGIAWAAGTAVPCSLATKVNNPKLPISTRLKPISSGGELGLRDPLCKPGTEQQCHLSYRTSSSVPEQSFLHTQKNQ